MAHQYFQVPEIMSLCIVGLVAHTLGYSVACVFYILARCIHLAILALPGSPPAFLLLSAPMLGTFFPLPAVLLGVPFPLLATL